MSPAPSAATRVFALLGEPVAHSLSPRFQNAALRAAHIDAVYVALRCAAAELPGVLRGLALAGGGGNVTIPHKELAARMVERATDAVAATGACNTYWAEAGVVCGDNTDVAGVQAAVRALLGEAPAGARVLLLGAGGAARAVVHALLLDGAERVVVLNRSRPRAQALAERFGARGRVETRDDGAALRAERFDLAVNATSLGMHAGDALPLPPDTAPALGAALDLVVLPGETAWVRALREREIPTADGREMLLQQGAEAFRRWFRQEPPLEAMRAVLSPVRR